MDDEEVYKTLFPNLSPTSTARLGVAAESTHIERIAGERATLLLALLKNKEEAESFFRPTTRPPAEDAPTSDQESPTPPGG